jgi:hypothetical protein
MDIVAIILGDLEQLGRDSLPFALHDTIERALGMFKNVIRGEGNAVATGEEETFGETAARLDGEIGNFRNVGQIIQGIAHGVGFPFVEETEIVRVLEDLEVEQADAVARFARGLSDEFEAEGFQAEIDLRVHETTGVDEKNFHTVLPRRLVSTQFGAGSTVLQRRGPGVRAQA